MMVMMKAISTGAIYIKPHCTASSHASHRNRRALPCTPEHYLQQVLLLTPFPHGAKGHTAPNRTALLLKPNVNIKLSNAFINVPGSKKQNINQLNQKKQKKQTAFIRLAAECKNYLGHVSLDLSVFNFTLEIGTDIIHILKMGHPSPLFFAQTQVQCSSGKI